MTDNNLPQTTTNMDVLTIPVNGILQQVDALVNKSDVFNQIATRAADPNQQSVMQFQTFDLQKLEQIANNMPEINRATNAFGRQNSQTTNQLMSLTMLNGVGHPYRTLRQCLAQIERKRQALSENISRIKEKSLKLKKLMVERNQLIQQYDNAKHSLTDGSTNFSLETMALEIELLNVKIERIAAGLADSTPYVEGALKEIMVFQEAYNDIKKNNNIPDNWDEKDFEDEEIRFHIRMAFRNCIRDFLAAGRINHGTCEYMEQFGINEVAASMYVRNYLAECEQLVANNQVPSIDKLELFLDSMYEIFKDEHKKVMSRMGLSNLIHPGALYRDMVHDQAL